MVTSTVRRVSTDLTRTEALVTATNETVVLARSWAIAWAISLMGWGVPVAFLVAVVGWSRSEARGLDRWGRRVAVTGMLMWAVVTVGFWIVVLGDDSTGYAIGFVAFAALTVHGVRAMRILVDRASSSPPTPRWVAFGEVGSLVLGAGLCMAAGFTLADHARHPSDIPVWLMSIIAVGVVTTWIGYGSATASLTESRPPRE